MKKNIYEPGSSTNGIASCVALFDCRSAAQHGEEHVLYVLNISQQYTQQNIYYKHYSF